jgi:N-acetylmuramoyl-L-alanine amidase
MKKLLVVLLVLAMSLIAIAASAHITGKKICLDPGHGGSDPGAVGNGLQEKDLNLDITNRAYSLMVADTASVNRTRSTDVFVSLQGRCDISNNWGADLFECSHINAGGGTGTETYACATGGTAWDLCGHINSEMVSHIGLANRGLKTANYYVLVNTVAPAILCEVAFIDTAGDAAILGNPTYRQEAARAYLHGTQSFYGVAPHDPTSDVIVDNSSGSFSASGNWITGTSSADKYGADYRYRSTAALSDPATWTPNLPSAGNYAVYAWWPAGSNRSASAPYVIKNTGADQTVRVNQQTNGGKWNLLGTYSLAAGTADPVQLSCWTTTGFNVMADAIKWVKQ